jgi:trehalose 6-phosphate synthase/phosphatase
MMSTACAFSGLAGSAQELEDALLINPYDVDAFAAALMQAIDMTGDEHVRRMLAMRKVPTLGSS